MTCVHDITPRGLFTNKYLTIQRVWYWKVL